MEIVYTIFEWLLVIALIGLFVAVGWLISSVLKLKNGVMSDAKRIYVAPVNSTKTLIATGKGIAQQETVRAKHMAGSVKVAAGAVKATVGEVKVAAEAVHFSDLKPVVSNVQNVLQVLSLLTKVSKATASKQGTSL